MAAIDLVKSLRHNLTQVLEFTFNRPFGQITPTREFS
jgi:hypothetical protein